MNKEPLVSIILPTYNRASLIKRCVESVINQSYKNWELIISDDASKDDTVIVAKRYAILDSRIFINTNRNNQGLPRNRNIALTLSRGDLVFFIEDDLILHPECVETLLKTYNSLSNDGIKVGAVVPRLIEELSIGRENRFNKNEADKKRLPFVFNKWTGEIFNNYTEDFGEIQETITGHACCLYSIHALKSIGGYEENAYKGTYSREETDMNFRLTKKGYKFYFQPKAVAEHKKINTGGCRISSNMMQNYYYYIRNHMKFLVRIFGIKSTYMIPCFLCKSGSRLVRNLIKNM